MTSAASHPDVERIERAMRAFKRIADARRVQRRMHRLAGVDLEGTTFVALVRVAELGPIRLTDLAAQLWLDLSVVSRKIRQLEERGFVERTVDPDDARAARVTATARGAEVARLVAAGRHAFLYGLFEQWEAEDTRRFADLLERFVDSVTAGMEREDEHHD